MYRDDANADSNNHGHNKSARFDFLDGMRGWASLAVLFWHVFISWYPITPEIAGFMKLLILSNGVFAVDLFFVISGFALSIIYIRRLNFQILARVAAGRYLRLAIPIFAACFIVHCAMVSGIIPPFELRASPYNRFLAFEPTLSHLFSFSFFDVFFRYSQTHTYIPPLWTMSIELFGSLIVVIFLMIFGRHTRTFWLVGVLLFTALIYQSSYYSLFIAGVLLAKVYASIDFANARLRIVLWVGFLIGCLSPLLFANNLNSPLFMILVIMFFASVLWLIQIRQLFENSFSVFLGRISFPLYLVHAPVLWTFSLWLKAELVTTVSNIVLNLMVGFAACVVSIVLAVIFSPINNFAIYASRSFGSWLVSYMECFYKFLKVKTASQYK